MIWFFDVPFDVVFDEPSMPVACYGLAEQKFLITFDAMMSLANRQVGDLESAKGVIKARLANKCE